MTRRARRGARSLLRRGLGAGALVALLLASPVLAGPTGEIRVSVVGLRSDEGKLRYGLYARKEGFATKDGPVASGARPILNGRCEFVLPGLPYGTYAVIVGHDVNGDGEIDANPFSRELKGISNYTGKVLWFPDFGRARFRLERASVSVEIRVY